MDLSTYLRQLEEKLALPHCTDKDLDELVSYIDNNFIFLKADHSELISNLLSLGYNPVAYREYKKRNIYLQLRDHFGGGSQSIPWDSEDQYHFFADPELARFHREKQLSMSYNINLILHPYIRLDPNEDIPLELTKVDIARELLAIGKILLTHQIPACLTEPARCTSKIIERKHHYDYDKIVYNEPKIKE